MSLEWKERTYAEKAKAIFDTVTGQWLTQPKGKKKKKGLTRKERGARNFKEALRGKKNGW